MRMRMSHSHHCDNVSSSYPELTVSIFMLVALISNTMRTLVECTTTSAAKSGTYPASRGCSISSSEMKPNSIFDSSNLLLANVYTRNIENTQQFNEI